MGKVKETQQLYNEVINEIVQTEDKWLSFLNCASWNFKYNFDDQVLIYAQRPNAKACASMEIWNKKVHRWVNKDANVIFVLSKDEDSKYPFRLVFDVSDTHNYMNTPYKLWEVKEEYENEIIENLCMNFGDITTKDDFAQAINLIAYNIVADNMQDYLSSIHKYKSNTELEKMSDDEIQSIFLLTLWSSVSYMMMKRCNINMEKEIDNLDFSFISKFSNDNIVTILGTATSEIAQLGLREIAKTVTNLQKEEKRKNRTFVKNYSKEYSNSKENIKGGFDYDRTRIHESGRLQYSESNNEERNNINAKWKIRQNEIEISKERKESRIYDTIDERQFSRTFDTNTKSSDRNDKSDSTEISNSRENKRRIENQRSNEMDWTNEQLQADSRGTGSERVDLQLELLTEEEQKQNIAEAEKVSAFSFSQEMIDSVLQEGSRVESSKFRIYEHFNKNLSIKENVDFLRQEYGIGGRSADNNGVAEEHNSKGIKLSIGYGDNAPTLLIKWTQVEKRIRELIGLNRYLSEIEKDEYFDWLDANDRPQANKEIRTQLNNEEYKLAERLHSFIKDYDFYSYIDNVPMENTDEENIELIRADINDEINIKDYIDFFKSIVEDIDNNEELAIAKDLLEELEKRLPYYELNNEDIVYIGTEEYEIRAIDDNRVILVDTSFPLLTKEMPRKEFNKKVIENPANDKLRNARIIQHLKEDTEKKSKENNQEILDYYVGQVVYLETDKKFKISKIDKEKNIIELLDLQLAGFMPIFREESIENFERLYNENPLNNTKDIQSKINNNEDIKKPLAERLHRFLNEYDIYDVDEVTLNEVQETLNDKQKVLDTLNYFNEMLDREDILDDFSNELNDFIKELSDLYAEKDKIVEQEDKLKANIKNKRRNKIEYFDLHPEISMQDRNNYKITNNELGEGTPREKYQRNVQAIKILKQCEIENRYATQQEQEILSKYVGWGGLADVFDKNNSSWSNEYKELKELLTEREYTEARQSTLTAFYTPPIIIKAIYKALENMGLQRGNVLEPSCRSRKFYGNVTRKFK